MTSGRCEIATGSRVCCGQAGSFGYEAGALRGRDANRRAGFAAAIRGAPSETMIVADGFSCREQIGMKRALGDASGRGSGAGDRDAREGPGHRSRAALPGRAGAHADLTTAVFSRSPASRRSCSGGSDDAALAMRLS